MSVDTMRILKTYLDNPISKLALRFLLRKDKKYGKTYLEIAIEDLLGENSSSSLNIRIAKAIIKKAIKNSAKAFNVSFEDALETFRLPYARRALVSVLKGILRFGVTKPFTPGAPFLVVWDYTYRCNLRCKHCYIAAGGYDRPEMSLDERKKALDILADAGVTIIAFSGGEPLMGPGIFEMIKRADEYGMYTAMATNGTLITEQVAERLAKAGLKYVQISLDAPIPHIHDEFRGINGAWERTVRGIRNAKKAGLYVEISMTITKLNYHLVPQMLELAKELEADLFMHYNFIPTGRGAEILELDISPQEREKLLRLLAEKTIKNEIQAASTAPQYARVSLQLSSVGEEILLAGHFYRQKCKADSNVVALAEFIGGCGAGRAYIALEPNGDIQPCVFMPIKVGNILKDDFNELWMRNKVFLELRNRELLKGACANCQYKYVCGGCRARAYAYFKDYLAPDPGCIYNIDWWNRAIVAALGKQVTNTYSK